MKIYVYFVYMYMPHFKNLLSEYTHYIIWLVIYVCMYYLSIYTHLYVSWINEYAHAHMAFLNSSRILCKLIDTILPRTLSY